MEAIASRTGHDLNSASRKAQEATWRRFEATEWLESFVGSLGISNQPSEREFISCLRNGLIPCNAINKIKPGSVPKVQVILRVVQSEIDYIGEDGSLVLLDPSKPHKDGKKVVSIQPCFWPNCYSREEVFSDTQPLIRSVMDGYSRIPRSGLYVDTNRQLDLSTNREKQSPSLNDAQKLDDSIVKALADYMIDAKENLDGNLLTSLCNGNMDSLKSFSRILSSTLEKEPPRSSLAKVKPGVMTWKKRRRGNEG